MLRGFVDVVVLFLVGCASTRELENLKMEMNMVLLSNRETTATQAQTSRQAVLSMEEKIRRMEALAKRLEDFDTLMTSTTAQIQQLQVSLRGLTEEVEILKRRMSTTGLK